MNEETKNILRKIGRLFSACLSIGALAMFFYILLKSGILPVSTITGQNREYEQGWALFFFLIFGIPCLLLFMAGLVPWIVWFHNHRKKKKEAVKTHL